MKTKASILLALLLVAITILGTTTLAKPNLHTATNTKSGKTVSIPEQAIQKAPHVFSLGEAVDPESGLTVEGYAIITPKDKKSPAKPQTTCGNGICEAGESERKCPADCSGGTDPAPTPTSSCYGFLAKNAKWKSVEPWIVNPENTRNLDHQFVFANLTEDILQWEDAADGNINNGSSIDILGEGSLTYAPLAVDTASPDGQNEVIFANIEDSNAIAITIAWGIFGGAPQNRVIVEWDQVYDDQDFDWSATGEAGKMDFWNIAIHELGHSIGLGDLYTAECSQETMYGYASEGEINKRDLNAGDITGISKLY